MYSKSIAIYDMLGALNGKFQCKFLSTTLRCKTVDDSLLLYKRTHSNLYVHAKYKHKAKEKRKRTGLQLYTHYSTNKMLIFVVGEDSAGTYLHYILPAHPDHNCEKDALVRRQKGPEGSYPSLSGR